MQLEFFEREMGRVQDRFNETFGAQVVCDMNARQTTILAICQIRILARNIDQAQLNKAYYDYFFEGLLKSVVTAILPILFTAAYINHAYAPESLIRLIGREYIFTFSRAGGDPIAVSAFSPPLSSDILIVSLPGSRAIISISASRISSVSSSSMSALPPPNSLRKICWK